MKKYITITVFGVFVAASFLVGYGAVSEAHSSVPCAFYQPDGRLFGRDPGHGYFTGQAGTVCLADGAKEVYPSGIRSTSANQFINRIMREYRCENRSGGACAHYRRSSSFIIQTMLGIPGGQASVNLSNAQIQDWQDRVRYAASQGRVDWSRAFAYDRTTTFVDGRNPAPNDVLWYGERWHDRYGSPPQSIVFYNGNGTPIYVLIHECANPVMDRGGLPPAPPEWTIQGNSTVQLQGTNQQRKNVQAKPGETVTFRHTARNQGPDRGSARSVAYQNYPGQPQRQAPDGNGPHNNPTPVLNFAPGQTRLMNRNNLQIPTNANVGQRFCQYIRVFNEYRASNRPGQSQNSRTFREREACAIVAHKYNLNPTIQIPGDSGITSNGEEVTFNYFVRNNGPTQSRSETWRSYEIRFGPNQPVRGFGGGDNRDCNFYRSRGAQCRVLNSGTTTVIPDNRRERVHSETTTLNEPSGTTVCRVLEVENPTEDNAPRDRWSDMSGCFTVGKRPTVHFLGGDVAAGRPFCGRGSSATSGGIYTVATDDDNGAMVEYGAFVEGLIQYQRSLSYGFGTASNPATQASYARQLSFANTGSLNDLGNLGSGDCLPDYYAQFQGSDFPVRSGAIPTQGEHTVRYDGDLVLDATTIADGASILVVVDGNVTIRGNITYQPPYANRSAIPSLAIVASGNIRIRDNVTQLDGVYSTRGTFHTCINGPTRLTQNDCNQQLTVNGAVIAGRVELRRTFGADGGQAAQPAERFHYTTELFFNNALSTGGNRTLDTTYQRDLPARY